MKVLKKTDNAKLVQCLDTKEYFIIIKGKTRKQDSVLEAGKTQSKALGIWYQYCKDEKKKKKSPSISVKDIINKAFKPNSK